VGVDICDINVQKKCIQTCRCRNKKVNQQNGSRPNSPFGGSNGGGANSSQGGGNGGNNINQNGGNSQEGGNKQNSYLQMLQKMKSDRGNFSIELRQAFIKADEECCYNCNYCPHVVVKRYVAERAKYARLQYPLTTTYKSDYRPFKPSLPENDIKIMSMVRNWGVGPGFLHHAHLDSMSSPDVETLYQATYKPEDCCAKKVENTQRYLCAGDSQCTSKTERFQRKFTLLGTNPEPHHSILPKDPLHHPHCKK